MLFKKNRSTMLGIYSQSCNIVYVFFENKIESFPKYFLNI